MPDKQPLVSMITYCYNGERFISKYFEAVLAQTYQNIELIFINNGSADRTGEIAEEYAESLRNRGITVEIIHFKENQNTCEMKQLGFSKMHGDYFFGCDSDDIIHPTYIEEMSGYLQNNPDKGIVFCQLDIVEEETGKKLDTYKVDPNPNPKGAFLDMLCDRNSYYTAISHMINKEKFIECNGDLTFEKSDYGENPQIQLPLLYHDMQGYINKPLGNYTVRRDSYSGKFKTDYEKQIRSSRDTVRKLTITLDRINPENKEQYVKLLKSTWYRRAFYSSLHLSDKKLRKECFEDYKKTGTSTFKDTLVYSFRPIYLAVLKSRNK